MHDTTHDDLSEAATRLYASVMSDFELTDPEAAVLVEGLRSWDRAEEARKIVDSEGVTMRNRFGHPERHPAVIIERDSRRDFVAAMRQLGLASKYEGGERGGS